MWNFIKLENHYYSIAWCENICNSSCENDNSALFMRIFHTIHTEYDPIRVSNRKIERVSTFFESCQIFSLQIIVVNSCSLSTWHAERAFLLSDLFVVVNSLILTMRYAPCIPEYLFYNCMKWNNLLFIYALMPFQNLLPQLSLCSTLWYLEISQ